jgi:hypothetical protein
MTPHFRFVKAALARSPYEHERRSAYIGRYLSDLSPTLLGPRIFINHGSLWGGAGTGKTSALLQLISELVDVTRPCSFLLLDGKADTFELIAQLKAVMKDVRWVTLAPNLSSYRLNPFDQSWYKAMPECLRADFWSAAFNLNYGIDWSKAYFAAGNSAMLDEGLKANPKDFTEYEAGILAARSKGSKDGGLANELKGAGSHVEAIVRRLKHVECLHGESTIDLADLFKKPMGIYFALPMAFGADVNRYVGTIVLQGLFAAAATVPRRDRIQVFVIIDESSRFCGRSSGMMLQQARSLNISMFWSFQSLLDLKTQSTDIGAALEANAAFQWVFSATTAEEQERLVDMSGETVETVMTVTDDTTLEFTTRPTKPHPFGMHPYPGTVLVNKVAPTTKTSWAEKVVNRLNVNELNIVSSHPTLSLLRLRDQATLGAINIIEQQRHLTEREYKKFVDFEWPEGNSETTTNTYKRRDEPPALPAPEPPPNLNKDNSARPKKRPKH